MIANLFFGVWVVIQILFVLGVAAVGIFLLWLLLVFFQQMISKY